MYNLKFEEAEDEDVLYLHEKVVKLFYMKILRF